MKTTIKKGTQYAGIDYSRGLSNCDKDNNIRYGVISQNSVMGEALEDIFTHGEDIAWKEALAEALAEAKQKAMEEGNDPEDINEDEISEDRGLNWESSLNNYRYEREGYVLTGCLSADLFVIKSPFFTFAQFCSPCVPGAGNLDCPFKPANELPDSASFGFEYSEDAKANGFPQVYCLGHDWFENGIAPYPVFDVVTGKQVSPNG